MPKTITAATVTNPSTGSWGDIDLGASGEDLLGSDESSAEAALVMWEGGQVAFRINGTSDDPTMAGGADDDMSDGGSQWVGLDSNATLEAFIPSGETPTITVLGYALDSEYTANTTADDIKSASTPGATFTNFDISTEAPSGLAATIRISCDAFSTVEYGFRMDGSTDSFEAFGLRRVTFTQTVPLSGSQIFELYCNLTESEWDNDTELVSEGYWTANYDADANGTDMAMNTTSTWTSDTPDNAASGDIFANLLQYPTNGQQFDTGIRPEGSSADPARVNGSQRHVWWDMPLDGTQQLEIWIADNRQDTIEYGRFQEPAGGPTEISLTGSQPASTGALSVKYEISLTGSQPASTGPSTLQQTLLRSLAGDQPAPSGALISQQTLLRSLAGNQPASTGAVTALSTLFVSLAGDQPASTGSISSQSIIAVNLAGSQPASTGVVSSQSIVAINLAGSQPASTGALGPVLYSVSLAGSQPASTGALSAQQTLFIALAGSQPASSGDLTVLQFISLVGSQPASTGTVVGVSVTGTNRVIVLTGRYDPTITLTGRSSPTITLTGQS